MARLYIRDCNQYFYNYFKNFVDFCRSCVSYIYRKSNKDFLQLFIFIFKFNLAHKKHKQVHVTQNGAHKRVNLFKKLIECRILSMGKKTIRE